MDRVLHGGKDDGFDVLLSLHMYHSNGAPWFYVVFCALPGAAPGRAK